jgi:hypothetical protein
MEKLDQHLRFFCPVLREKRGDDRPEEVVAFKPVVAVD